MTIPAGRSAELAFRGTNGFRFGLQMSGPPHGGPAEAVLRASHGKVSAEYKGGRAFIDEDGSVSLHLPGAGRIELEFKPGPKGPQAEKSICRGRTTVVEEGTFHGTIDIHGRKGFSDAEKTAAPGAVHRSFRLRCHTAAPPKKPPPGNESEDEPESDSHIETLAAAKKYKSGFVQFVGLYAEAPKSPPIAAFLASKSVASRGVEFLSAATSLFEGGTIEVPRPERPHDAIAKPPAPFRGSARFHLDSPKRSTWHGHLTAELPGFGAVSLAGPQFSSALCVDEECGGSLHFSGESQAVRRASSRLIPSGERPWQGPRRRTPGLR